MNPNTKLMQRAFKRKKMSFAALATKVGVSEQAARDYLAGKSIPNVFRGQLLAGALEQPLDKCYPIP